VIKQLQHEKLQAATSKPSLNVAEPAELVSKELKKNVETTDQMQKEKTENNAARNSDVISSSIEKERDPAFRLPRPADFDEYWYKGDDGQMYNEYNDELEEGYYYEDNLSTVNSGSQKLLFDDISGRKLQKAGKEKEKSIPRPSDYDECWYEGDDGQMYNEYDDELQEGEYYEDVEQSAVNNMLANGNIGTKELVEKSKQNNEALLIPDPAKVAEETAKAAAEEATKAVEEATKAVEEAAEASKNLLKGMSNLGGGLLGSIKIDSKSSQSAGLGFGLGGIFSNSEPQQKPKNIIKSAQMVKQEKRTSEAAPNAVPLATSVSAAAPLSAAVPASTASTSTPSPVSASMPAAHTAAAATKTAIITDSVTDKLPLETVQSEAKEVLPDERNRRPKTAGFNAHQRWKWAYAMVKKVKKKGENLFLNLQYCSSLQDRTHEAIYSDFVHS
jgi:hypothetical protein